MDLSTPGVCMCVGGQGQGWALIKSNYFLELKHHEDFCSRARKGSYL